MESTGPSSFRPRSVERRILGLSGRPIPAPNVRGEWITHYGSSKPYFREGLIDYMKEIHNHFGGCPAVLLTHQRSVQASTHVRTCLQHVVSQVGLPMWLPGSCHKTSHIILRHRDKEGKSPPPEEVVWETSFGPVRAVRVPPHVFNLTL